MRHHFSQPLRSLISFRRAFVFLTAILLFSLTSPHISVADVTVGQSAPDFTLSDQSGKSHTLSAYKGKTVVLEWTNPTCPFVEFHYKQDTMTKLAASYPDVVWLTVNSSYFATAETNQKWAKAEGVKTVLIDRSGAVGRLYGARTTPHMFIINPKGELVYQGAIDDNPHMDQRESRNYVAEALKALKTGARVEIAKTAPYGCSVKYAKK